MRKLRIDPSRTAHERRAGRQHRRRVGRDRVDEAARGGMLAPGSTVLLCAAGAGFTFGASVWSWA